MSFLELKAVLHLQSFPVEQRCSVVWRCSSLLRESSVQQFLRHDLGGERLENQGLHSGGDLAPQEHRLLPIPPRCISHKGQAMIPTVTAQDGAGALRVHPHKFCNFTWRTQIQNGALKLL